MKQFTMTEEEFSQMQVIAHQPMMMVGSYAPNPQKDANSFWKRLAKKYGFVWDSVRSADTGNLRDFSAEEYTI